MEQDPSGLVRNEGYEQLVGGAGLVSGGRSKSGGSCKSVYMVRAGGTGFSGGNGTLEEVLRSGAPCKSVYIVRAGGTGFSGGNGTLEEVLSTGGGGATLGKRSSKGRSLLPGTVAGALSCVTVS